MIKNGEKDNNGCLFYRVLCLGGKPEEVESAHPHTWYEIVVKGMKYKIHIEILWLKIDNK